MSRPRELREEINRLQSELDELKADAKEQWARERGDRAEFLTQMAPQLLILVTEHDRTSCSDENPMNEGHCLRCTIIRCIDNNWWDADYDIEITLTRPTFIWNE